MNNFKLFGFMMAAFMLTACNSNGMIRLYDGVKNENEVVTFKLPIALDLLEVDGQKMKSNFLLSKKHYQLQVLPGKHFLKAVYSEYWGTEKFGNIETSRAFYFAVDTTAGSHYVFKHNGPKSLVNANRENSIGDIAIWVEDQNTGIKIKPANSQSYGAFINDLMSNNKKDNNMNTESVPLKEDDSSIQINVSTQLKYWWKLANEKQRQSFRQWVDSQP